MNLSVCGYIAAFTFHNLILLAINFCTLLDNRYTLSQFDVFYDFFLMNCKQPGTRALTAAALHRLPSLAKERVCMLAIDSECRHVGVVPL